MATAGDGPAIGATAGQGRSGRADGAIGLVLLAAGGIVGAGCILGGVAIAGGLAATADSRTADMIYALCIALPLMAAALAGGVATGAHPFHREHHAGAGALGWLALGCGGVTLAAALAAVPGGLTQRSGGFDAAIVTGSALVALQAVAEEIYLRGWLQPALARHWPRWAAVLATALLFAALHMLGGARSPLSLLNLALGGLLFGLLAMRTGGLAAPIAAHVGWNWGEQLLLGLDPNPGVGSFGALIDLDLGGAARWGGSDEGLNASVAMTIVLALLLAIAWRLRAPAPSVR